MGKLSHRAAKSALCREQERCRPAPSILLPTHRQQTGGAVPHWGHCWNHQSAPSKQKRQQIHPTTPQCWRNDIKICIHIYICFARGKTRNFSKAHLQTPKAKAAQGLGHRWVTHWRSIPAWLALLSLDSFQLCSLFREGFTQC